MARTGRPSYTRAMTTIHIFDRFTNLLISLLLVVVVHPLVQETTGLDPSLTIWVFVILPLVSAVIALAESRRVVAVLLATGGAAMALRWIDPYAHGGIWLILSEVLVAFFFGFVTAWILRVVIQAKRVTKGVISAALCVYMLFGYVWALLYSVIQHVEPASFTVERLELMDFIYFSFVTLSTVGYGDVAPVSATARSLANVEAIVGQFYLAVLISRLVALYSAHPAPAEPEP